MHPNPAAPRPEYREIDRDPQGFFFCKFRKKQWIMKSRF